MVARRRNPSRTKHSSSNSTPCEQMKKLKKEFEADGQNAEVINSLVMQIIKLKKKLRDHHSRLKKLERTVDWIGNYVEEQTGLEAGRELTDSSDSSLAEETITIIEESEESDSDYAPCRADPSRKITPICLEKKVKPRRNPTRAVRSK
jgi:hypothetical protein